MTSHEKKMSKLFFYDGVVKRLTQEKMMRFDEEYLRSTSNKILLQQC